MPVEPSQALVRLANSRRALVERMRGDTSPPSRPTEGHDNLAGHAETYPGKWSLARHVMHAWWRRHPVSMVADLAQPVLARQAHRHPLKLLGCAVAAGAAIAVLRPWRILPVSVLLATLLKTSDLAAVAAALITPQEETPRKEPS
jgi:hypothetical protein